MLGRGAQSTSKSWLFPSLLVCAPITTNYCCVQPLIPRMRPPPINKGTEYEGTGLAKSPGASRLAKLRQTPACFLGCSSAQVLLVILFFLPHRKMVVRGAVVLLDGVDTGRKMERKEKKDQDQIEGHVVVVQRQLGQILSVRLWDGLRRTYFCMPPPTTPKKEALADRSSSH